MPNGQFLVGKGKVEDVAKRVLQHKADAVVFDDELSLAQQRSLNKELACMAVPMICKSWIGRS